MISDQFPQAVRVMAMDAQSDLFGEPDVEALEMPVSPKAEPLAMPCGFLDSSNKRCRRLAHRPVMMNGKQLTSYGRPMLHCPRECFYPPKEAPVEQTPNGDTE